jgi:DnaJ homolog subfamily C member 9
MENTSDFIVSTFGERNLYDILGVEKTAAEDEIRRAYRKLALVYHPDRTGGDAEKFKALSMVHSILSDTVKRSLYDSTGEVDGEGTDENFKDWYDYFRNLFPALTLSKIEDFSATYIGSEEERQDLIDAYQRFDGNLSKMMSVVMLAEVGDEERLCGTIDSIISFGDLVSSPEYESCRKKVMSNNSQPKKNKRKTAKVKDTSEADLAAMMLANRSARGNGMASIMAKYGSADTAGSSDISDAAFMETQNRIQKDVKAKKSRKG